MFAKVVGNAGVGANDGMLDASADASGRSCLLVADAVALPRLSCRRVQSCLNSSNVSRLCFGLFSSACMRARMTCPHGNGDCSGRR